MFSQREGHMSVVTEKIFTRRHYPVFIVLSCVSLAVTAFVLWNWFSVSDLRAFPILFLTLTLLLIIKLAISQARWYILPSMERPLPVANRPGWTVAAVTTVVPGAEPLDMLERTVKALVALDYPHDTWVLDEGDDDEVKALCRRLGARHFSRKNRKEYQTERGTFQSASKHGNYNSWLTEVGFDSYDIIATFDADHVPEPSMLSHVLGYFNDSTVGYVQLPQAYYNKRSSFIARGAAEETYAYHACTQPTAFALGHPIIIGGHSTHRASALKEIGGLGAHAADDLLTTLVYRANGWRGIYVPRVLARGLTPVDWSTYLTQQLRWAKSVLDIKLRYAPRLSASLPPRERSVRFLHGLTFVECGITTFAFLLIVAFMLATGNAPDVVRFTTLADLLLLGAVGLLCESFRQRFYLEPATERGVPWRSMLLRYAKWPYLFWAFCQVARGHQVRYTLTRKAPTRSRQFMLIWPHSIVVLVIGASWLFGTMTGAITKPVLHFLAATIVLGSIVLILTEFFHFPAPFDTSLSPQQEQQD